MAGAYSITDYQYHLNGLQKRSSFRIDASIEWLETHVSFHHYPNRSARDARQTTAVGYSISAIESKNAAKQRDKTRASLKRARAKCAFQPAAHHCASHDRLSKLKHAKQGGAGKLECVYFSTGVG
jgi:hypothetical protein